MESCNIILVISLVHITGANPNHRRSRIDPDCCDYYGDQALMLAIERDSSDDCKTVKLCLDTGQFSGGKFLH